MYTPRFAHAHNFAHTFLILTQWKPPPPKKRVHRREGAAEGTNVQHMGSKCGVCKMVSVLVCLLQFGTHRPLSTFELQSTSFLAVVYVCALRASQLPPAVVCMSQVSHCTHLLCVLRHLSVICANFDLCEVASISSALSLLLCVPTQAPISGKRYRCLICANFDLCDGCFSGGQHPQHPFACRATPTGECVLF